MHTDPGSLAQWLVAFLSIVFIDIVLAGDNAIAIALAARTLPKEKRLLAISLGAAVAVVLRIALTFVAGRILDVAYLKLIGGLMILWIAVKLLLDNTEEADEQTVQARSVWSAIGLIVAADVSMSLDNVLAVAGASHGNFALLLFGLGLSIPLVVFASNLLSALTEKYPLLVYFGAAILGKIGGELIMTDAAIERSLHPAPMLTWTVEIVFALAVSVGPGLWRRHRSQS
ncbi:MAG: TerC family protein [Vicinamibacterales bacterium]